MRFHHFESTKRNTGSENTIKLIENGESIMTVLRPGSKNLNVK
jgi:hypothetical protein